MALYPQVYTISSFGTGDLHRCLMFEWMHNVDLGLLPLLREGVVCYIAHFSNTGLKPVKGQLDALLTQCPRYHDYYIPKLYFSSEECIQSKEHRVVIQASQEYDHLVCLLM
jgi:hypothetical protein